MKRSESLLAILTIVFATAQAWAQSEVTCDPQMFSQEERNHVYHISSKEVRAITGEEARFLITAILQNTPRASASGGQACQQESAECYGEDKVWTYTRARTRNAFGETLGLNGQIYAKTRIFWPNDDRGHETWGGYTCVWDEPLREARCVQWCALMQPGRPGDHD